MSVYVINALRRREPRKRTQVLYRYYVQIDGDANAARAWFDSEQEGLNRSFDRVTVDECSDTLIHFDVFSTRTDP